VSFHFFFVFVALRMKRGFIVVASATTALAAVFVTPVSPWDTISSGCPSDGPVSCNGNDTQASCCFESPGVCLIL